MANNLMHIIIKSYHLSLEAATWVNTWIVMPLWHLITEFVITVSCKIGTMMMLGWNTILNPFTNQFNTKNIIIFFSSSVKLLLSLDLTEKMETRKRYKKNRRPRYSY